MRTDLNADQRLAFCSGNAIHCFPPHEKTAGTHLPIHLYMARMFTRRSSVELLMKRQ